MPNYTYKIYYATLHLADDKFADTARGITVIFDIPFYRSSGLDSGMANTWLPFLGLQPYSNKSISDVPLIYGFSTKARTGNGPGWFRKPRDVGIKELNPIVEELKKKFPLPGNHVYDRFATLKCLLISAALGGGVWDTPNGKMLSEYLRSSFSQFFASYTLIPTDSMKHFNHFQAGISENALHGVAWILAINKLLEGKSGHDLSFNFDIKKWQATFTEMDALLTPNNAPLSLKLWDRKIVDYFSKALATPPAPTVLSNYTFFTPDQQTLQELGLTIDEYSTILDNLNKQRGRWKTMLSVNQSFPNAKNEMKIIFLDTGHIVLHPRHNYERLSQANNALVLKAFCITSGACVAIKVIGDKEPLLNPAIITRENPVGVMPIIGTCVLKLQPSINITLLVSPIYQYNLADVINSNKLSVASIERIFNVLLRGLRSIHRVAIESQHHINAKMFHGDIKPNNIFVNLKVKDLNDIDEHCLQPDQFEVCIADLDSVGKFDDLIYTRGFISPEMARIDLANQAGIPNATIENNVAYGRANDVWAMGLTLAKVLEMDNHLNELFSYVPNLKFVLSRQYLNKSSNLPVAGLEQSTIDMELNAIKESLPNTTDGRKLKVLWDIVHSMLQVATDKRPNVFDVINNFRAQNNRDAQVTFTYKRIPDYFPRPETKRQRQITLKESFAKSRIKM